LFSKKKYKNKPKKIPKKGTEKKNIDAPPEKNECVFFLRAKTHTKMGLLSDGHSVVFFFLYSSPLSVFSLLAPHPYFFPPKEEENKDKQNEPLLPPQIQRDSPTHKRKPVKAQSTKEDDKKAKY